MKASALSRPLLSFLPSYSSSVSSVVIVEYSTLRSFYFVKLPSPRVFDFYYNSRPSRRRTEATIFTRTSKLSSSSSTFTFLLSRLPGLRNISTLLTAGTAWVSKNYSNSFASTSTSSKPAAAFSKDNTTISSTMEGRHLGDCIANGGHCYDDCTSDFKPKKILVLTKLTRLEFERRTNPGLSEEELEKVLKQRGSDYKRLLQHHDVHKRYLDVICRELQKRNMEVKVVQRWDYDKDTIDWADAVMTAGGDGTFLLGASKIRDHFKPIIGINTDPASSEGYLCLMKKLPDANFPMALDRLLAGDFKWLWRQRLRVTLYGKNALDDPIELHDQQLMYPEYRWSEHVREDETVRLRSRSHLKARSSSTSASDGVATPTSTPGVVYLSNPFTFNSSSNEPCRVLPYLALNDVYIGESLSSRVSYYELQIDDEEKVKQKSSGLTVCTGTGSTSWYFNINKLTDHCVSSLMSILKDELGDALNGQDDPQLISRLCKKFNDKLIFCPSDLRMAYAVRDPVFNATYRPMPPRGFATKRIEVKSRCFDAHLVIDGGMSYIFNDGAKAVLEIHPEDALRTVIFR